MLNKIIVFTCFYNQNTHVLVDMQNEHYIHIHRFLITTKGTSKYFNINTKKDFRILINKNELISKEGNFRK